jgi:GDP-L-fucose synthase
MNEKIFVLGSSGYIGNILMRELPNYFNKVIGIDRSIIGDLTDYDMVRSYFIPNATQNDIIINCAASGGNQKLGEYNKDELWNNIKINYNLNELGIYYINIGSGAEYDVSKPIVDVVEGEFYNELPKDSYGLSKNVIARHIGKNGNSRNLRLFGCFDPTEPDYRFVSTCIRNCLNSEPIIVTEDKFFSWVSGIDLGYITSELIKNRSRSIDAVDLNCSYNKKYRLSELAYHVSRMCSQEINIKILNKNPSAEYSCNSYLLTSEYNFFHGLENSLIHYINEKIKI